MKRAVFSCLLLACCTSLVAQPVVLLMRDTTRYQISQVALQKAYSPLTDLFRAKPEGVYEAMKTHWNEFDAFIKKRPDVPKKAFGLFVHAYYQSTGKAQYILIETDQPQPDSVLANVVKVLTDFYSNYSYPARGSVPFQIMAGMTFGKTLVSPRTVRHIPGNISTVEEAQKTTRPDTVTRLGFNQLELTAIPEVVYRFPKLEELDLSKNALHQLPARLTADIPTLKRLSLLGNAIPDDSVFMTRNKHLLALNIQGNTITHIPTAIRKNRRLESLWLGNNMLASLDVKTLRRLRRLNDLNLYNAGLTKLPKSVGRLRHIRVLDLYHNKLTELPRQLSLLKRMEQLAVAHNDLSQLPASLAKLRRLQVLYAHHNRISQLPATFAGLKYLQVLDVSYNWFTVTPEVLFSMPALEELDLNNNNLQELPASLGTLKGLKKLYLRSNPLTRDNAMVGPYAPIIRQLEANHTEVFY